MRVSDIMTVKVASCSPDTSLVEVARLMCDNDCGAIPVLDSQGRPVGVVTDRDIACRAVAQGKDVLHMEVREILSQPVVTVSPDAKIADCCEALEDHQVRRVLVVDGSGALCGIVAQADIARHAPKHETAEVVREVSKAKGGREMGVWT